MVLLVGMALAVAPGALAHESQEHGVVTIHDEEDGPEVRTVHCEFFIKGHGMEDEEGVVTIMGERASIPVAEITENWTGNENGNGTFNFTAGPFTFHNDTGVATISIFAEGGLDENERHITEWRTGSFRHCPDEASPPEESCEEVDISAEAHGDESVTVRTNGLEHNVDLLRAAAGTEGFEQVATLDEENSTFHDTETEAHVAYEYRLVVDNEVCASVEITAIPVFPTMLAMSLATLGGLGIYGMAARRRRK